MQVQQARARRSDARRNIEGILGAAAELLAGNPRASMQDVADAAGVHRATVHRHFPSRDDLIAAVYTRLFEEAVTIVRDPALQQEAPRDALWRMTRATVGHGARWRTYNYARAFDPVIMERRKRMTEAVMAVLARGQQGGVVRRDLSAEELVRVWGGMVYIHLPLVEAGVMSVDDVAEVILTILGAAA